jgi:hypothetical protein
LFPPVDADGHPEDADKRQARVANEHPQRELEVRGRDTEPRWSLKR